MKRVLFVLCHLPRQQVSVSGLRSGQEPMSGTHASALLVADGLARTGWDVGLLALDGGHLTETAVKTFNEIKHARAWLSGGKTVWCYYGNGGTIERLTAAGIKPIVWSEIDLGPEITRWLSHELITGVVAVSDFSRLALLHHARYRRIGRIYNPLNPLFARDSQWQVDAPPPCRQAVYAGYIGESKGTHRVLQSWREVRRALPDARLVLAGSTRLYEGGGCPGPRGIADEKFEKGYIEPLVREFGSLENAGVHFAGLLPPRELQKLFQSSRLGIVNLNWDKQGETFSCAAVEMAACGLQVFSVAFGALPETVGRSGGAILVADPATIGTELVAALRQLPDQAKGLAVQKKIRSWYALSLIVNQWDTLLLSAPDTFYGLSGSWQYKKDYRYLIKKTVRILHLGKTFDRALALRGHFSETNNAPYTKP